jgi:hypothetical protein
MNQSGSFIVIFTLVFLSSAVLSLFLRSLNIVNFLPAVVATTYVFFWIGQQGSEALKLFGWIIVLYLGAFVFVNLIGALLGQAARRLFFGRQGEGRR